MKSYKVFVRVVLVVAFLVLPWPAFADQQRDDGGDDRPIIVGDGTAASCTEAALKNALFVAAADPGSTIRFNCGSGPVTISLREAAEEILEGLFGRVVPVALVVPNNTTIDGGGLITLLGAQLTTVFVDRNSSVVLKDLTISSTNVHQFRALVSAGKLTIKNSTVSNTEGGGIYNTGTLALKNSALSGNFLLTGFGLNGNGVGITNTGTLSLEDSEVSDNRAEEFGTGGIDNAGTLTVKNSTFVRNFSGAGGDSGGIFNTGTLVVKNSFFSRNFSDHDGGAITNDGGTATIYDSAFAQNIANLRGGGVANFGFGGQGTATIHDSSFSGNSAGVVGGGGGGVFNQGILTISDSEISGNHGRFVGGGIDNAGTLTIKDSEVSHNTATFNGGGIFSSGPLILKDTSVTDNTPNDIAP